MSFSSMSSSQMKNTLPAEKGPSAITRLGVQGDAPWTGIKGLGSTGNLAQSSMKSGPSRPISGGGFSGNAGVVRSSSMGGTGAGSGLRTGNMAMGGGVMGGFGSGGGDFGKIL